MNRHRVRLPCDSAWPRECIRSLFVILSIRAISVNISSHNAAEYMLKMRACQPKKLFFLIKVFLKSLTLKLLIINDLRLRRGGAARLSAW
jgi:hypothetical protein